MEVHKVNIAIVIIANASTDMVPPDMVIVTKGLKNQKTFCWSKWKEENSEEKCHNYFCWK